MYICGFRHLGKMLHEALFGTPSVIEIEFDEEPVEHVLHLRWEACGTCDATGRHVNPSIDAHGISSEEFSEDPDFKEEYFSGVYDVDCYECGGHKESLVINRNLTSSVAIKAAEEWFQDREDSIREQEAERRMGA